jgi:putative FmdB family regulatory protein
MPVYEFRCIPCDVRYEQYVRRYDETAPCPRCGGARVERLFSTFTVGGATAGAPSAPSGGCSGGG